MIKKFALTTVTALSLGLPATAAFAQDGNAADGENAWRECRSCHAITDDAGTTIQRGGRTGPNLYGIAGRAVGSEAGFNYSERMQAYVAGNPDAVWTRELFIEYVTDPSGFFDAHGAEGGRRGIMNYRMRNGQADMWAYLESVAAQ